MSLTSVADSEINELAMFAATESTKSAVDKSRLKKVQREKRAAAG